MHSPYTQKRTKQTNTALEGRKHSQNRNRNDFLGLVYKSSKKSKVADGDGEALSTVTSSTLLMIL